MDYYKIEIIDRFLKQELKAAEMASFKKAMAEDPLLKDAVDGYRLMKEDGVDLENLVHLSKQKIKEKSQKKVRKLNHWKISAIAASVVLLIGFSFYTWNAFKVKPSDYDFKDAGLPVHLDFNESLDYSKFTNYYKLSDYESALHEIDLLMLIQPKNDTLLYYKACILKEQKNYSEAIAYFKKLPLSSEYAMKADYQKAMCYWYLNDKESCLKTLNSISKKPDHLFYDLSLSILEKL